jgi:hypothetical protein
MDQVRDAAAIICREYPIKKRFMQSMAQRIVQRKSDHEVIAYDGLARRRTARHAETSGTINEVEELQRARVSAMPRAPRLGRSGRQRRACRRPRRPSAGASRVSRPISGLD